MMKTRYKNLTKNEPIRSRETGDGVTALSRLSEIIKPV